MYDNTLLKLFIWEMIDIDYENGLVYAYANNTVDALKMIKEQFDARLGIYEQCVNEPPKIHISPITGIWY